jgi:hypothetical protein
MIRDLRKFSKQTSARLVVGFMLLLFIVGDGLIYVIYGPGSALTGLLCLAGMMVPVVLIVAFLELIDWIVKRANRD